MFFQWPNMAAAKEMQMKITFLTKWIPQKRFHWHSAFEVLTLGCYNSKKIDTKINPPEGWELWRHVSKMSCQNKEYQTVVFFHILGPDTLIRNIWFQLAATKRKHDLGIAKFDQHFTRLTRHMNNISSTKKTRNQVITLIHVYYTT